MTKVFPIYLEIEKGFLGDVMESLNGMPGVAKLHLDLDNAPKKGSAQKALVPPGQRKGRARHDGGPRAKDVVIAMLLDGSKHYREIADELRKHGFVSKSSTHSVLNQLREKDIAEPGAGHGMHQLTKAARAEMAKHHEAKALPPPTAKSTAKREEPSEERAKRGIAADAVLAKLREADGPLHRDILAKGIGTTGASPKSLNGVLARLKEHGLIKSGGIGIYELTAKGAKQQQAITNGGTANG